MWCDKVCLYIEFLTAGNHCSDKLSGYKRKDKDNEGGSSKDKDES
jgi:hypothetical protein